jgi:two-component system chemotaxis sensor kinase CheA
MAPDALRYFRVEARELVDQISAGVLDLDQDASPEVVARLLRVAHTLKGAARVVRQQEIADDAHAFEEVLVPHRAGSGAVSAAEMRELLRLNDTIEARVASLEPETARAEPAAIAEEKTGLAAVDVDELLDAVGETHTRFAPLRACGRELDRLQWSADALATHLRTGRCDTDAARAGAVRLAVELGELGRRMTDTVEQTDRELDEVRGRAERLRLVPAATIFTGLHRAVRDTADALGRRVRFTGRGGELRMDPHVLTQVSRAFRHVVRNAVTHGIEDEAARVAAGKPAEGAVVVEVERRGRRAAFRCTDDGRGFDLAAVRHAAESHGSLPAGTTVDDQALLDLVLRGGISTSEKVTDVSGRGIGMDVARDVADGLGGEVSVRSRVGAGATVELVVPLALLSLRGLVLEAAGTVVTVPLDTVRTCIRLTPEQLTVAAATGRLAYDGEAVPFLALSRALYPEAPPPAGVPGVAVVVHAGDAVAAAGVDRLGGTSTLVVRPVPELAPAVPVVGGVTLDLDGNPRLVLDVAGFVAAAMRRAAADPGDTGPPRRLPVLVVDDSLTTRMLERSILESAGYEVDLAASGEEALTMARRRRYGLFLTDIDMPGMDGFTFVTTTRADPDLAEVPAILVSSRSDPEDQRRGAEAGASAYVVKGEFDQGELLAHIRQLMPRHDDLADLGVVVGANPPVSDERATTTPRSAGDGARAAGVEHE